MNRPVARRHDRATGVFGTAWGFTVVIVFLLFAAQVLFGLYARTTVTAVASDLAHRVAAEGPDAFTPGRIEFYRAEAHRRLGRYGDDAEFEFGLDDVDVDGSPDTVTVRVVADLPTLLPSRLVPTSPTRFTRTMRARLEVFQEDR